MNTDEALMQLIEFHRVENGKMEAINAVLHGLLAGLREHAEPSLVQAISLAVEHQLQHHSQAIAATASGSHDATFSLYGASLLSRLKA